VAFFTVTVANKMSDAGAPQLLFGQVDATLKYVGVMLEVIGPIKIGHWNVARDGVAPNLFMGDVSVRKDGQGYTPLQKEHGEKTFVVKGIIVIIPHLEEETVREIPIHEIMQEVLIDALVGGSTP